MSESVDLREMLHERKLRATPQRLAILETLQTDREHRHMSPKDVYDRVKGHLPGINVTTVYRTLEGLHEVGLLDQFVSGSESVRFALRHPAHRHGHLVCRSCEKVLTVELDVVTELAQRIQARYQFALDQDHLTLTGLCQNCS